MTHSSDRFKDRFGIIARTYSRSSLAETLHAVRQDGIGAIQLNLSCAGLPTLPERFEPGQIDAIADEINASGRKVVALSGTFNLIDPDLAKREACFQKLDLLAANCRAFGTNLITLCTGTRDPKDMWKRHPDNDTPAAWDELVESMRKVIQIADRHDILVAIEPELGNVIDSAAKARKLIDTIGSQRIKIIFDAANMIRPERLPQMAEIIDEAFELLGRDVAIIHAKEIAANGEVGDTAPGKGVLDFARIFRHAIDAKLDVPIVMHGLNEADIVAAAQFLENEYAFAESLGSFEHDAVRIRYSDSGSGIPFVFQHGLGGDCKKIFNLTQDVPGIRLITFDARFHGQTVPYDQPDQISFRQFADDMMAMLDHLKIEQAIVGGISMGAGMSLEFAVRYPHRVLGLVLARPAFFDQAFPPHVRVYSEVVSLFRQFGAEEGLNRFKETEAYQSLLAESADAASALTNIFLDPLTTETWEKYERIPHDCPPHDLKLLAGVQAPTLVLSSVRDPIHPYSIGQSLTQALPRAEFHEVTSKAISPAEYEKDLNRYIAEFLQKHRAETPHTT